MARGYPGAFGRKLNAPYVWLPLCVLFLAPFIDVRRPLRLLHLDLLVLLAFGVSHVFFNRGEIGVSTPLVYPVLLYLLARVLLAGFRLAGPRGPAGASRAADAAGRRARVPDRVPGRAERGGLERDRRGLRRRGGRGPDRGRRPALRRGLLHRRRARRHLRAGELPALRAVRAGAPLERTLGRSACGPRRGHQLRPARDRPACSCSGGVCGAVADGSALGVALAYGWVAYPYTAFALESNSNDSLVALGCVAALLAATSRATTRRGSGRGSRSASRRAAKFVTARPGAAVRTARAARVRRRAASSSSWPRSRRSCRTAGCASSMTGRSDTRRAVRRRSASGARSIRSTGCRPSLKAAAAGLALLVAFVPRRIDLRQTAALGAGVLIAIQLAATHWFYLYVVWFVPFVLVALFAAHARTSARAGHRPIASQSVSAAAAA